MATATLQSFNVFLTERLTAAAVDIYGFVERTVVEYQEEVNRAQQENQRLQRLLDLVYKPQIRLHRADVKQSPTPTSTEDVTPKQQDWSPSGCQDEPGPSTVKEEQREELWINGSEEQLSAEDSDDDGDALTKELIKTVQQLEDCRAAEESRESKQTAVDDPMLSEEKTSTTLYRCHICNYIFTKKTVLTWHLKTHEGKSQDAKGNFDCHICGKHIPCQSNLQNHMRVHTGERPYSCHFCGKCFKLKGHMTEHIRTHTGEKPFSCHICDKSFNRGSTLRKHVLAKHKEERPYKCGNCDELFTERLLMKRHMRKVHGVKLPTSQSPA
ncbi:zinc finger protein 2 homolog [Stegastes partitus]|uniref:Zinc finger protein 2 homolog n=1 Tax=Stegastes partitus TaxID=144197 RepID=A0A3B4Z6B0_9TELE|nr:PREDICTED: zinc finger protein 2 homolog [Stegastes partitus]XP_008282968.1 PREDICTED: zinc finger protein 2 homolog [Stegastes partitus]